MENFLNDANKAISFEERNITKTYLYISIKKEVLAYFTISLNILETHNISKSIIKKIDGIDKNRQEIACFLIAQLGKSDKIIHTIGTNILYDAIETIKDASAIIGGRVIVLDAINNSKVIQFYENNNFVMLDKTSTSVENVKMYYPLYV